MTDERLVHLAWDKGGKANVVTCDGEAVALDSSTPSPPGSRPEGALATGERFKMKVHKCARLGEHFRIEGRLLDATRAQREAVRALATPATPAGS